MRRFGSSDDDQWDPDRYGGEDYDEEMMEQMMGEEMMETIQIQLASIDINHKILVSAMQLLERSWLWKFRRLPTKLNMLKQVYQAMYELVRLQREEEKPPSTEPKKE